MRVGAGCSQEKYQPSYDCTVLTEVPLENAIVNKKQGPSSVASSSRGPDIPPNHNMAGAGTAQGVMSPCQQRPGLDPGLSYEQESCTSNRSSDSSPVGVVKQVTKDSTAPEVMAWLKNARFGNYIKFFANYTGGDLLTLTREELIQICGLSDGIRLNNALQVKTVRPRLTLYVNIQSESVFHVLYLSALTCQELIEKLANLFNASPSVIVDVHLLGVNKIHILVNDEVVQNMPESSQYTVEVLKMSVSEESTEQYRVLLSRIDGP